MKCYYCEKEGRKSRLYSGGTSSTCMYSPPYYDEDGNYHHNDPNYHMTSYECSNGHRYSVTEYRGRQWIGHYLADEEDKIYLKGEPLDRPKGRGVQSRRDREVERQVYTVPDVDYPCLGGTPTLIEMPLPKYRKDRT